MGRGRSDRTIEIVDRAFTILEAQHPMTLRQLFYQLVSVSMLENRQADYQRLSRILTDARERGEVPWEWMVDRSRPVYESDSYEDLVAFGDVVARAYRKNYWADQPCHIEIWTEKDAILGSIQPVTEKYGVTVRVGRGFQSTTRKHEIAEQFSFTKKPIHVFYLGDHDPSGHCIEEDIQRRIESEMKPWAPTWTLTRLAIFARDIENFRLPPQRLKTSDSRAVAFYLKHGAACVELDALPPVELRQRLEEAILEQIDRENWERCMVIELAEQKSVREIAAIFGKTLGSGTP